MAQILGKFFSNVVPLDDSQIRLRNNNNFVGRNAANSADIGIVKVNTSDRVEFASIPQASGTPSSSNDLVNKNYADNLIATGALKADGSVDITGVLKPNAGGTLDFGTSLNYFDHVFCNSVNSSTGGTVKLNGDGTTTIKSNTGNISFEAPLGEISAQANLNFNNFAKVTGLLAPSMSGDALRFNELGVANGIATLDATGKVPSSQLPSSGAIPKKELFTLTGTDITNQYVDLLNVAVTDSIDFVFNGLIQFESIDYTVNYTGGAGGKTRITFSGDIATAGDSALVSGDVVLIKYSYL